MVANHNASPVPTPPPAARIAGDNAPRTAANAVPHAPWWAGETPIRLSDVPRILPPRPDGRRVSIDAIYRWSLRGLHGIRLRRYRCGGSWASTEQELARWQAAITAATETAK